MLLGIKVFVHSAPLYVHGVAFGLHVAVLPAIRRCTGTRFALRASIVDIRPRCRDQTDGKKGTTARFTTLPPVDTGLYCRV